MKVLSSGRESQLNRKPRQGDCERPGTREVLGRVERLAGPQLTQTFTVLASLDDKLIVALLSWVGRKSGLRAPRGLEAPCARGLCGG